MNAATEILAELRARGIRVQPRPNGGVRLLPARLIDSIQAHKAELLAHLHARAREAEIDRLATADGWNSLPPADHPAYSIVATCHLYDVALRISESGDLVVGKPRAKAEESTQPWRSLNRARSSQGGRGSLGRERMDAA